MRGNRYYNSRTYTSLNALKIDHGESSSNFCVFSNESKSLNSDRYVDLDAFSDFTKINPISRDTGISSVACTPYAVTLESIKSGNGSCIRKKSSEPSPQKENDVGLSRQETLYQDDLDEGNYNNRTETMLSEYVTVGDGDIPESEWSVLQNGGDGSKFPEKSYDLQQNDMDDEEVSPEPKTPSLTFNQLVDLVNKHKKDPASYFDNLSSLTGSKYIEYNKVLKLFWLSNDEVFGLLRVPTLSTLNQMNDTEKIYVLFTPMGIDIVQDVSHVKNVGTRPNKTPFVVLYSYNFKSMYFRVVPRLINDSQKVVFVQSRDGESISVKYKNNQRYTYISGDLMDDDNQNEYLFYRGFLPGVDVTNETCRVKIHVQRYKSLHGTSPPPNFQKRQETYDPQVASPSNVLSSQSHEYPNIGSVSGTNISDSAAIAIDCEFNLPKALASECKLLAGLESVQNKEQSSESMANFRLESMLKRNFAITSPNGKRMICENPKSFLKGASDGGDKVLFRANNSNICEGDAVQIRIPTIYRGHYEYDRIRLYNRSTLVKCSKAIKEFAGHLKTDVPSSIAQYCPCLFWNLALYGHVDVVLSELCPSLVETVRKRKRNGNEPAPAVETPLYSYKKPREDDSTVNHYMDNNFIMMQSIFDRDARAKIEKLLEIQKSQNYMGHKPNRKVFGKNLTNEELLSIVLDDNCFPKVPMQILNDVQRRLVYQECMRRNYFAPIHIDSAKEKGRGVYAAFEIGKDDFVVEYKGELITGKIAKNRDEKYSRSRTYMGSFIFHFKHDGRNFCIDATEEDINFGPARLINHSRRNPNLVAKTVALDNFPRLFFVAKRNINWGEELLVDYGERDPEIIKDNPWLLT
ncbi:bifunctional SET domain superfamily/SET domain [Babesia duncani]|uniref:Bifunctional SET domain superfamily/SET domain n=1 Tax=Babesia duncani TaxID=323732 RepID=A0AAD9PLV0_9APIC|nr:bifunctional SET domain superfamily/SET domain [Babesia duncani]